MNARNYKVISHFNKRSLYPLVDDKVQTKTLANKIDINTPKMIGVVEHQYEVTDFLNIVDGHSEFVVKPAHGSQGKGVLVSHTTAGNYIVGPSSELAEPDDVSTDTETLNNIKSAALLMVPSIPFKETIRVFAGERATCTRHDFIIEYAKSDKHFINVAGIESPGLASAPAIAEYVVEELIRPIITLKSNPKYNPCVKKYHRMFYLSEEEKQKVIKEKPEYALSRSCPPVSIKGIKRRTRAGYGKCQGGFCQPKVLMILAKHYGVSPMDIPLAEDGSYIIDHEIKKEAK